eukprot:NODE_1484_length_890_cov_897.476813_g1148_i0.p1 GENE.NODE_1484_length_890_cov_897.476813_g1148_i0~~NODE_1484_length_890_cov_897.476813_g1148_i0.p1  ORF type:complete len:193 (+),score=67.13 NODE_1484_length_890_cov_897.476813_g1148_i0:70-648(+)
MSHTLPTLPFPVEGGIPPSISPKQLELHYNKHHNAYVTKLNGFCADNATLAQQSLEDIIKTTDNKAVFNNAAQHYNHSFYWNCLTPNGKPVPAAFQAQLDATFGSVAEFQAKFSAAAMAQFGSGWAWLVRDSDNKLKIVTTGNADVPITTGETPLLVCDVWEHAYYVDHLNRRDLYLESFWKIVNWEFVASQ